MTTFLVRRRRPSTPRPRLVSVSDHWSLVDGEWLRDVTVQMPGGQLVAASLDDDHPALLRFLGRAAVAA